MRRITALAQVGDEAFLQAFMQASTYRALIAGLCCIQPSRPSGADLASLPTCLQDYARRRSAFGALLIQQPLAQRTLGWLHLHTAASLALTLEVARLQGAYVLACLLLPAWRTQCSKFMLPSLFMHPSLPDSSLVCLSPKQASWSAVAQAPRTVTCCAC